MPITAQCNCGKRMNVADALAGRTIRCPSCGSGIAVGQPAPVNAPRESVRDRMAGKFYISPGKIIAAISLVTVVTLGILFAVGPMRVWNQWETIGPVASDNIKDVVGFALEAEMSTNGMYDPNKSTHQPQVDGDVMFYRPLMAMSMPDKVKFTGSSNEGPFTGFYNPNNGEIEADVAYGGYSVAGLVDIYKAPYHFHMTGRKVNDQISAEADGQPLKIYYPVEPKVGQ
jgi:hypothetical protein